MKHRQHFVDRVPSSASWWQQAEQIRDSIGNTTNAISGGIQHGPVLQGRDFSNITFGAPPPSPSVPPS